MAEALRLAVVGMSATPTSGMRDHAELLSEALGREHVRCSVHWLAREQRGLAPARAEASAWARALHGELAAARPHGVLMHYASFAYSYRGVPLLLAPALAAVRLEGTPLITFAHELVYPLRPPRELRANTWALTQRVALIALLRASAGVVVTTDYRAGWLSSRRWLPRRAQGVAPVYSNLPEASTQARPAEDRIGLFGYSYEGVALELVLDAIALLHGRAERAHLRLLGSPGPDSEPGRSWSAAAAARGLGESISFSGRVPAQELSDELARCELLLCAANHGPTSSRGTLAASLASGRPVVAIDGPRTWSELIARDAARVVAPNPQALADELAALLASEPEREALGARGRELHEQRMDVAHTAALVAEMLRRARE